MTKDEMQDKLKSMGLEKSYRPYQEPETGVILLETKKPARIVDGTLNGSMIDVYDNSTVRIWTAHKKKANAIAKQHGLKVRLLDGEAELFVPAHLADEILPMFGVRVKREMSPKQAEVLKQARQRSPILQNFGQKPMQEGTPRDFHEPEGIKVRGGGPTAQEVPVSQGLQP